MSEDPLKPSKRVLEPSDRISEVLFGLIMVLTFTGSLSVAEAGRDDVRVMLIGALGCNIAWGIIDGVLYLMGCLAEKGRNLMTYQAVRKAANPQEAQRLIAGALPSVIASVIQPAELESLHQRLQKLPEPPARARLVKDDWLGALAVFFWVFITTFPVAIPFIFMTEVAPAMRASNGIAIAMLFITGFAYGRYVGRTAWGFGISMVILGAILVALTIALGG
jgi:VIT1/CCC1 family predicted Fe2+/Mn2+ transporter